MLQYVFKFVECLLAIILFGEAIKHKGKFLNQRKASFIEIL